MANNIITQIVSRLGIITFTLTMGFAMTGCQTPAPGGGSAPPSSGLAPGTLLQESGSYEDGGETLYEVGPDGVPRPVAG